MKYFLRYRFIVLLSVLFAFITTGVDAQVTITSSDSVNCTNTCTTLTANIVGDAPIDAGVTEDDIYSSAHNIGFTFNFYGNNYTQCLLGANGNISFNTSLAGQSDAWEITNNLASNGGAGTGEGVLKNCIAGPYCDIDIFYNNTPVGTETYSTDGVAPYRKFVITWCGCSMFSCGQQTLTSQIIMYETTNIIEVHIAHHVVCNNWNGGYAIVGVKNADGTNSIAAPGRDYPTQWTATDEAWRFTPVGTGTSYTVSSIPYAPVPYATSSIYWYNAATDAYLGSGASITVCPTVTTTYKAAALGCADSSFGYYAVVPTGQFNATTIPQNPTQCGYCNGSITIHGVFPSTIDTLFYEFNGVAQTPLVFTPGIDSNITLSNLCVGIYSDMYVKTGFCISNTMVDTLSTIPLNIDTVTFTNPSNCNTSDGTLTLHGLIPGQPDTINYTINGVPQLPVVMVAGPDSTVTFYNLGIGTFSNITYGFNGCISNSAGPVQLTVPPLIIDSTNYTNPTYCGACNGTIYLRGMIAGMTDTVSYHYFDPVTGDTVNASTMGYFIGADSSILLTNLCAGFYSDIVVHSGLCVSTGYGPIQIVNPPLVISNVQVSSPDGCGVCDGVIQLSTVPVGQIDTIKYRYNGVWVDPPVVFPTNMNQSITLVDLCAGEYDSIIVTNKFGCVSNVIGPDSLKGPQIQAAFTYTVHPGCNGTDTVYFSNTSNPSNDATRWHFGDGTVDTLMNPVHSYPTGKSYNVTLYTSNLPCIDSTTQTITLSHPLIASFTSTPGDTLCQGTVINFTNTSTGGVSTYLWNLGDGTPTLTDQNPPPHIYNATGVYTVSLVVNDTIPCFDTAKALVYVDSNSAISFKLSDTSICAGQQVIFTANYTRIGGEGISWNFGDGFTAGNTNPVSHTYANGIDSAVITLSAAYRVCPDTTAKETVYIHPYPIVNLGPDTALCPGGTPIALGDYINAGTPGTKWIWNTGDTTSGIVVTVPDLYYVTVTQSGCSNSDSVLVKHDCYIDIPNVFTPNGDGLNDYFFPRELLTSGATKFSMEVYNRWGQEIFSTTSTEGLGWDGKFNGVDQPEGVYIYIIDVSFKNGKSEHHQGNVTLLK